MLETLLLKDSLLSQNEPWTLLENSSGVTNIAVNGSGTPVSFSFAPDLYKGSAFRLYGVRFVFMANSTQYNTFADLGVALTNGLKFYIGNSDGSTSTFDFFDTDNSHTTPESVKDNQSLFLLASRGEKSVDYSSGDDMYTWERNFRKNGYAKRLSVDGSDKIWFVVSDDLTSLTGGMVSICGRYE